METVVLEASWLTPGMRRIVVGGDDLEGFGAGGLESGTENERAQGAGVERW